MFPKATAFSVLSCYTFSQCRGHYSSACKTPPCTCCLFNIPREMPFNAVFQSSICLVGCWAHFGAIHFAWSLQVKVLSFDWISNKQQPTQESQGSHLSILEPCPTGSAGLDEAVFSTKYCDNSWWGFQKLFHVSKSKNNGYQTNWLMPALACFTSQHGCWMTHLLE